jgi:hypothetical protein
MIPKSFSCPFLIKTTTFLTRDIVLIRLLVSCTRMTQMKPIRGAARSQVVTLLCALYAGSLPRAVQRNWRGRANDNSMIRLHAGLPGGDSVQTGPTSCHSMVLTFKDADTTISAQRCCGSLRDLRTVIRESGPPCSRGVCSCCTMPAPVWPILARTGSVACAVRCWTDHLPYHLDLSYLTS